MGRRGRDNLVNESFFFVTTTVVKYTPVFKENRFCDILIDNIKYYQKKYQFSILGYVIMPTHFHWIVKTKNKLGTISEIMRDIKKYTAWQIFDLLKEENNREFNQIFENEAKQINDQKMKLWMSRFDDEVIRNQKMFWTKLKYIHNNPVKSELVEKAEDYKYSSARNYVFKDSSILEVDTEYAGIEIL